MTSDKRHDDEVRALDRQGASPSRESLVPASYAEKAMSSLLRLHEDLVEEKEKRIDLYRRLMEREQSLAEMRAYMKLLESELARRGFDPTAFAIDPVSAPGPTAEKHQAAAAASARQAAEAPPVVRQAAEPARPPAAEAPPVLRQAAEAAPPAADAPIAPQPVAPAAARGVPPPPARRQVPAAPPSPPGRGESSGSPVIAWTPGPGRPGNVR